MTALTYDSIALRGAGVVNITQPAKGVRFTLDSLLLADFCRIKPRDRVLELGAGTGVISLLLAKKFPHARFVADECEPEAYGLLCKNVETNGLTDRIVSIDRDVKHLGHSLRPHVFTVIVANPPYTRTGTGRQNPSPERLLARQDQSTSLQTWLMRRDLLQNKGRYFLVFPASRVADLLSQLRNHTLEPKRLRFVHPKAEKPASLVLVEAVKSAGSTVEILPPLIVHETNGGYTEELRRIYDLP
jgi:tRNA1Val (adenine37-N6)-methyltransferase